MMNADLIRRQRPVVLPPDSASALTMVKPIRAFVLAHPTLNDLLDRRFPGVASLVHVDQQIEVYSDVGKATDVSATIRKVQAHGEGHALVETSCVVLNSQKDPVAFLISTVRVGGSNLVSWMAQDAEDNQRAAKRRGSKPAGDLTVTPPIIATQEFVDAYAKASNDHNPVHLDAAAAQAAGFPRPLMHGMSVFALALAELAAATNGSRGEISACGVRFAKPALVGDELNITFTGTVTPDETALSVQGPEGLVLKQGWVQHAAGVQAVAP